MKKVTYDVWGKEVSICCKNENLTNGDMVLLLLKLLSKDKALIIDASISLSIDHRICIEASDMWWNTPYLSQKENDK